MLMKQWFNWKLGHTWANKCRIAYTNRTRTNQRKKLGQNSGYSIYTWCSAVSCAGFLQCFFCIALSYSPPPLWSRMLVWLNNTHSFFIIYSTTQNSLRSDETVSWVSARVFVIGVAYRHTISLSSAYESLLLTSFFFGRTTTQKKLNMAMQHRAHRMAHKKVHQTRHIDRELHSNALGSHIPFMHTHTHTQPTSHSLAHSLSLHTQTQINRRHEHTHIRNTDSFIRRPPKSSHKTFNGAAHISNAPIFHRNVFHIVRAKPKWYAASIRVLVCVCVQVYLTWPNSIYVTQFDMCVCARLVAFRLLCWIVVFDQPKKTRIHCDIFNYTIFYIYVYISKESECNIIYLPMKSTGSVDNSDF